MPLVIVATNSIRGSRGAVAPGHAILVETADIVLGAKFTGPPG